MIVGIIMIIFVIFVRVCYLLKTRKVIQDIMNMYVITFANHKGGVGKTTQVFFLSKYIASVNKDKDVILIDGSIYKDLTRLCIGDTEYNIPTIEGLFDVCRKREREQPKTVGQLSLKLRAMIPNLDIPNNLHLITNENNTKRTNMRLGSVNKVRKMLNRIGSLNRNLIVICDTDGGMMHDLTCLSIGIADSIVVPLPIDTQSILRMNTLLEYIKYLHKHGYDTMKVSMFIYSNLPVINNVPSKECQDLDLPFKVNSSIIADIIKMKEILKQCTEEFPNTIDSVSRFYGIRNGGATLQQAKTKGTPFHSSLSPGIDSDLKHCSQLLMKVCQKVPE